ncbi:GTP-binding protein, partial [Candidatus Berkelbacteria bacterium]|nr:GTP-binding protein [Candidatus Berkelbacteria bacterium]
MTKSNIRNFVIIAHIDAGKSTLADRFLEITQTVAKEKMRPQFLDQNPLERERGITIKMAPVRMVYKNYILNLIDTPGHVDFSYEVSRALACVEGAVLLVDATQGVQAQTLANLELARRQNLKIIPALNKIDLQGAEAERTEEELKELLSFNSDDLSPLKISAKTGEGAEELLERIIQEIPSPQNRIGQGREEGGKAGFLRALIFDSFFDPFRGVVLAVRVFEGEIKKGDKIKFLGSKAEEKALEIGVFSPPLSPTPLLSAGEIGYIVTGLKDVSLARVGDTVITTNLAKRDLAPPDNLQLATNNALPLLGYEPPKPMVFAEIYPESGEDFPALKKSIEQLKLNDASFSFEPTKSAALGAGFRSGFLGLLHLEIVKERLEREFAQSLVITSPQVDYRGNEEPWVKLEIITPPLYLGQIMEEMNQRRGKMKETKTLGARLLLIFEAPLSEIILDFYDCLKSLSSGYASLNYEFIGYREADLVKLEILVAGEVIEPFSRIVVKSKAERMARTIVEKLKELIPRQWFEVKIQARLASASSALVWRDRPSEPRRAAVGGPARHAKLGIAGGKILASESISPLRKDVT